MHIAFFVNGLQSEYPRYTTTALAMNARERGHDVCYVTPDDFILRPDDGMSIKAVVPRKKKFANGEGWIAELQADDVPVKTFDITDVDILMLRNDPSLDAIERPWAAQAGIVFGQFAVEKGVIVLNDPAGLAQAQNKLYFQKFPSDVRTITLISKDATEIKAFVSKQESKVIVKPLQGSGGKNVFMIKSIKDENFNQIIESLAEEGYIIVQSYLSEAKHGDIRLFLMNGRPLEIDGKYAAVRRVPSGDDIRSNMHAKGVAEKVTITADHLRVAELVRPKLLHDGMFLVGLDIVGDKLLEINVFSPGALMSASDTQGVAFADPIIQSMERKVEVRNAALRPFPNRELAVI
ncbi:glutathione synthetase [Hyphomicrobium sp. CS1GBMeth3]|uniref:glutathione synthetase n=1 Tax=Hyphomicrobium sp. CS1GBMeth3 TaxID=1892845 RepID=UPI00093089BA|nr:glutathione synthetase [Hyphomicrobium sp. CS1GBMeth3]